MGSLPQYTVCTSCGSKSYTMNYSNKHLSNEDRLFMAMPPARPSPVFSLTVVGGKVVANSNGQQLMMQVDRLTSAMMDMQMDKDKDMQEANEQNLNTWTSGSNCLTQQQILQQQLLLEQQKQQQLWEQQQTYQLQQQKQHEHQLQQYGQLQQEQQR